MARKRVGNGAGELPRETEMLHRANRQATEETGFSPRAQRKIKPEG